MSCLIRCLKTGVLVTGVIDEGKLFQSKAELINKDALNEFVLAKGTSKGVEWWIRELGLSKRLQVATIALLGSEKFTYAFAILQLPSGPSNCLDLVSGMVLSTITAFDTWN